MREIEREWSSFNRTNSDNSAYLVVKLTKPIKKKKVNSKAP